MEFDDLSKQVIGCALEVHRHLGPGLLESAYKLPFQLQAPVPIEYKDVHLDCGYRIDVFVASKLIVELKSVERLLPIHEAQLLTYMKLAKMPTGLLINFNVRLLKDGIKRFVL
jgi:GxxExxY protein